MPPMPPRLEIVNVPPCIWSGLSLPSRASFASSPISLRDIDDALLIGVAHDRHDEPVRRVGGETDVAVLFQDEFVAVEGGVELGEFRQRRATRP